MTKTNKTKPTTNNKNHNKPISQQINNNKPKNQPTNQVITEIDESLNKMLDSMQDGIDNLDDLPEEEIFDLLKKSIEKIDNIKETMEIYKNSLVDEMNLKDTTQPTNKEQQTKDKQNKSNKTKQKTHLTKRERDKLSENIRTFYDNAIKQILTTESISKMSKNSKRQSNARNTGKVITIASSKYYTEPFSIEDEVKDKNKDIVQGVYAKGVNFVKIFGSKHLKDENLLTDGDVSLMEMLPNSISMEVILPYKKDTEIVVISRNNNDYTITARQCSAGSQIDIDYVMERNQPDTQPNSAQQPTQQPTKQPQAQPTYTNTPLLGTSELIDKFLLTINEILKKGIDLNYRIQLD